MKEWLWKVRDACRDSFRVQQDKDRGNKTEQGGHYNEMNVYMQVISRAEVASAGQQQTPNICQAW